MVNTGRPSQGCGTCRARRIKCDERKPTCFRCQKSKRICSGYRGDIQYIPPNKPDSPDSGGLSVISYSQSPTTPTAALTIPIEDQSIAFFFKNFVLRPSKGNSRNYMEFTIPAICEEKSLLAVKSMLSSATLAVAVALLGTRPNSRSLLPVAGNHYAKVLRKINDAIKDPVESLADQTLATVLLLGIFELVTGTSLQPTGWCSHADGACMLVKSREESGIEISELGRTLHVMARSQMVVNCITTCKPLLFGIDWWMQWGTKDGLPAMLSRLHLETTDINARLHSVLAKSTRRPQQLEEVLSIISQAKTLHTAFKSTTAALPKSWEPQTIAWVDPIHDYLLEDAPAYPGKIETYADFSIATALNMIKASQLIIISNIIKGSSWLRGLTSPGAELIQEYNALGATAKPLIGSIISSTFSFLDDPRATGLDASGMHSLSLFAVWPLRAALSSEFTTTSQRKWISGRLRFVAREKGIKQADQETYPKNPYAPAYNLTPLYDEDDIRTFITQSQKKNFDDSLKIIYNRAVPWERTGALIAC